MIEGWTSATAGIFKHWDRVKSPLNGHACMHIKGNDRPGDTWFVGEIQFSSVYDEDNETAYMTRMDCEFKACADDLENWFEKLILRESKMIEDRKK